MRARAVPARAASRTNPAAARLDIYGDRGGGPGNERKLLGGGGWATDEEPPTRGRGGLTTKRLALSTL